MTESTIVEVVPIALAGLVFENLKGYCFQEGFLLGEIVETAVDKITDNDQCQRSLFRAIKITACLPCPAIGFFYDAFGRLELPRLNRILQGQAGKVVAWYKFKQDLGLTFTYREHFIHHNLAEFFNIPLEHFFCCFVSSEVSPNSAIYSTRQNFFCYSRGAYNYTPFAIMNLNKPFNFYKIPQGQSEIVKKIVDELGIVPGESSGLPSVINIQNRFIEYSMQLVADVATAEKELFDLETEVEELTRNNEGIEPKYLQSIEAEAPTVSTKA